MNNVLHIISILSVVSGFLCALIILLHIFPHHRQPMKIMESVWPLTGLWTGWIGLWAYLRMGIPSNKKPATNLKNETSSPGHLSATSHPEMNMGNMNMEMEMDRPVRSHWQTIGLSTLHCGAGCTLADIIGEWFTFFVPLSISGSMIAGQWTLDYLLALILGIFFQYAAIRPMEHLSRRATLVKAFKIDFFSLTSWQIGMYGWMAVVMFVLFRGAPFPRNSWEFWFMMQIAMCCGFLTSYPTNWLLIRLGIKKGM